MNGNTKLTPTLLILALAFLCGETPVLLASNLDLRAQGQPGDLHQEKRIVKSKAGIEVELWSGTLLVPENRLKPKSPPISIPFYRLAATTDSPGAPVFLLAGGPGSSWIDRFENLENFAEVEFYRGLGDVVLFDQRGAGHSKPKLDCDQRARWPYDQPLDPLKIAVELRKMASQCRRHWLELGVDLAAYNTRENAADVLALQSALGYETMILVGGSYGSHLAFALMREAPERIKRTLLYGIEGPDHTWDDPDGQLATLERIAGAIETSSGFEGTIPDHGLIETLRASIAALETNPLMVPAPSKNADSSEQVMIDAHLVRRLAGLQAGRRSRPGVWPRLILDLHQEQYALLARGATALRTLRINDPMHFMIDCASGVSEKRAQRYRQAKSTEILGPINTEYQELCATWQADDLGARYRSPMTSDIPTLLVHGTWDTSTPIENAREMVAGLRNGHLIEVIGGNHGALYNLYEHWPRAHRTIGAFLRGEMVHLPSSVTLHPLNFANQP